jgi:hypothetical protein
VTIPPLQIEITRVCLYTWAENRPERQFQIIEGQHHRQRETKTSRHQA